MTAFLNNIKLKANSLGLHLFYSEIVKDLMEILIGQFFPVTPFVHICLEKQHAKDNNRENIFSMNSFDYRKYLVGLAAYNFRLRMY